jgi:hypothetical protein
VDTEVALGRIETVWAINARSQRHAFKSREIDTIHPHLNNYLCRLDYTTPSRRARDSSPQRLELVQVERHGRASMLLEPS